LADAVNEKKSGVDALKDQVLGSILKEASSYVEKNKDEIGEKVSGLVSGFVSKALSKGGDSATKEEDKEKK
jgi:hypothetical protein